MPVIIHPTAFTPATEIELAPWRRIGTATISDALDRAGGMDAAIKPIADGMRCVGEALTVRPMIGDNSALHYAMTVAWPGAVVVVESRGHDGAALWGDVIGHAARLRGQRRHRARGAGGGRPCRLRRTTGRQHEPRPEAAA